MTTQSQPLSPEDAAALRMLAGANFGPGAKLTLPSGREIGAEEAQALSSAYAPAHGQPPYQPGDPYTLGQVMPQQPRKRRRWPWVAAGAALLVVLGALAWALVAGRSFTVAGTLVLNSPCSSAGRGGYSDIRAGAQVVVTDAAGKTLATGNLGAPEPGAAITCGLRFTVEDVPAGHDFYGLEVSHRGVLQYPAEKLREGDVLVSLG